MAEATKLQKIGLTPGKAVLIAVLAVVFLGVLIAQFSGGECPTATAAPGRRSLGLLHPRDSLATSVRVSATVADSASAISASWPEIPLEQVCAYDPFALPASLVAPSEPPVPDACEEQEQKPERQRDLERREKLRELQQQGVRFTLINDRGEVATIGKLRVRVGDVIQGLRVVEIRPNGSVVVEFE